MVWVVVMVVVGAVLVSRSPWVLIPTHSSTRLESHFYLVRREKK